MVRISSTPVRSPTCASRGYSWPPKFRWLIRPSLVRSNSAPQASSSQTRSGASWACNSAIRQWLRNLPPRMVSRKCTCQLSLALTLPMEAAIPPSAMTVCALPKSDLQTIAVRFPCVRASIAARRPAPPAPITTTSKAGRSISVMSRSSSISGSVPLPAWCGSVDEAEVVDPAGGHGHHVEVGERQGAQRDPRELHVPRVQARHPRPHPVADRVTGEVLEPTAGDVPAGVAGHRVGPQHDDVDEKHHVAETEAELVAAAEGTDGVVRVD